MSFGCRYLPILPMVLVNGAEGIGTGWSTSIPNYNPLDIVTNVRRLLDDEEPEDMNPWYKFYQGEIYEVPASRNVASKSFQVSGIIQQVRMALLPSGGPRSCPSAHLCVHYCVLVVYYHLQELCKEDVQLVRRPDMFSRPVATCC